MGFKSGSFATVWETKPYSSTMAHGRISIERKDPKTDKYVQEWGGYVTFLGTACVEKAMGLRRRDRIKLGSVDVTNKYDAEKKVTYTNFNIYSFDIENGADASNNPQPGTPAPVVDEGEISSDLPF